ncbi:O-antigen ligase family protein [Arthrobacter pascens]|uniref:O-antigen ligase family protein n=1 Tax=Arthrobacter pascens TaxID=1677 RepID=UPI0027D84088|nr:O-antigen ligase family protein [Arthrobacter pascens]
MLLILASAGIAFATTESVRRLEDAMQLVRWLLAGASVCCVIAIFQFVTRTDPLEAITDYMIGFVKNTDVGSQPRGMFMRVAGTTMHPIELGVVSSMLLPLSVWRAVHDKQGSRLLHWITVALLVLANAMTVSRSALIGLLIALLVTIPFLPRVERIWAIVVAPLGAAMLFLTVPGLITTMIAATTAGNTDPSITYRTNDYPLALRLLGDRPWLGIGPGTWIPTRPIDNFDNEYLLVAVTMGVVGLIAFIAYLLVPVLASFMAAWNAKENDISLLSAAVAAAGLIATVTSGAFDSMSFPVFALLCPFFIGLSGGSWLIVKSQLETNRSTLWESTPVHVPHNRRTQWIPFQ